MIDKNRFRLGNYYIRRKDPIIITEDDLTGGYLYLLLKELNEIPVEESLLLDLGITPKCCSQWEYKDFLFRMVPDEENITSLKMEVTFGNPARQLCFIRYISELQNLIYSVYKENIIYEKRNIPGRNS